ncbi:MAG: hypothetical protein QM757_40925 [Paludibaculum sp.]
MADDEQILLHDVSLGKRSLDAVGKMKQFATYFTHGVRNGAKLRTAIYQSREATEILSLVNQFFERELTSSDEKWRRFCYSCWVP